MLTAFAALVPSACTAGAPAADGKPLAGDQVSGSAPCGGHGRVQHLTAPFGESGADRIAVYLPPCYDADPGRRFPLLVLLHGANADESQWLDVGVATDADQLLSAGLIEPFIIALPDGGPAVPDSSAASVTTDLLPWIDAHYHTDTDRRHRAIGGISRGGRLALLTAEHNPEMFSAVGAHSPAVQADDASQALADAILRGAAAFRFDVGGDDPLRTGIEKMIEGLGALGATIELHIDSGTHDRAYWRAHAVEYLEFYNAHLQG